MTTRIALVSDPLIINCTRTRRGVGIEGLSISLVIRRNSDSYYWNGSDWVSGEYILTMVEIGSGAYNYDAGIVLEDDYFCHAYIVDSFDTFELVKTRPIAETGDSMQLDLTTAIEDTTIGYVFQSMMAMFNGRFVYDSDAKTITFYDRTDNVFSVISVPDDKNRVRIS
jgi:hypothetical protein